ncbi:MAG: CshA/CshB family fibrillar adhesin-related protein [Oscillospiraceae bacterium]
MNSVQFANPTSGVMADKIGWIFYGTGAIYTPGAPPVHVINSLPGGGTVEFDLSVVNVQGPGNTVPAVHTPTYYYAAFGSTGYTGIPGDVALFPNSNGTPSNEIVKLQNIVVKDANGIVRTDYQWVAADAENTDTDEALILNTDGSPWSQLTVLPPVVGPPNSPSVSGLGTTTVTEVGTGINHANGNVYITRAPKNVSAQFITYGREAVAFGIIFSPFEGAIADLIESVALQQAGLSHVLNAEGEKIQAMLAMPNVTPQQLLAVNKSVQDMTKAIAKLEMIMQSKLETVGAG